MFYFEKLDVYQKAKAFNSGIRNFINNTTLDSVTNNQLRRAAFGVVLNLAEGSGRFTSPDRRNFYIVARSCVFDYIAILDVLNDKSITEAPPYTKKKATQAQSAKSQQASHVNCDFAFGPEKAIACAQIASNTRTGTKSVTLFLAILLTKQIR
jgi:four helix bundle protein